MRWMVWRLIHALKLLVLRLLFPVLWMAHELVLTRLRLEKWRAGRGTTPRPPRIVATACWQFPIYSQTFVHQEVLELARAGFAVRFLYARLGPRAELTHSCDDLWPLKRRLLLHPPTGRADLAHFRRRMPAKVEALIEHLAAGAGLRREEVERHEQFLEAFSFARAVEAWGADYIHSYFFYEQTLFALVASQLLGIPRGVSCYADHLLQDYPLKVVPLHLRTCSVIVATSLTIRHELEGLHGGPLQAIVVKPNAIDTSSFQVKPRRARAAGEPLRLLSVNRLDPKKGLEYLIEAVRTLLDRHVAVEVDIVGAPSDHSQEGPLYEQALRAQVATLGLARAVRFSGQRNSREVRVFLENADVFVASSVELPNGDKDGIPTAVLEAMAAGCVIVATSAGSICEVIDDGREGLIVPQRDAGALADAVERLAHDEILAARLSATAAARARRDFDVGRSEVEFHGRVHGAIERRRATPAGLPEEIGSRA